MWSYVTSFFHWQNVFKVHTCSMNQHFIPFCGSKIFHHMEIPHFIYSFITDGHLGCSCFLAFLWKMLLQTFSMFLCGHTFPVLLGEHLGVEWLAHTYFKLLRNCQFFKVTIPVHIPNSSVWVSHILTDICYCVFLMAGILLGMNWYFTEVLISISLTANDVEHFFFHMFIDHLYIFFREMSS